MCFARRYRCTQYAYLDDVGAWQIASSPTSDGSWVEASGGTNWSLAGSGPPGTYVFGNYNYNEFYGNSGSGGASGSGWTESSYGGSTPDLTGLPAFPSAAAGPSSDLLSGTDTQTGDNYTSYSFQTHATFNGVDWSETGLKFSSGSGGTTDSYTASASGLTFTPSGLAGPYDSGIVVPDGSASVSGTSDTSYSYSQYAYLDDNGVWQIAATPASDAANGVNYFGVSGSTTWSLSGSGPPGTYLFGNYSDNKVYGNSGSGTTSASGSGSNSYNYKEFFSYSPATGLWTPTGGSGSASGGGSASFSYSANGPYSALDGDWLYTANGGLPLETILMGVNSGTNEYRVTYQTNGWSGAVSASGEAAMSYGYSTNSTFTPASGWTSTGSASASASGSMGTGFSASAGFTEAYSNGSNSATMAGTASGGGSDWGSYHWNQTDALASDGWSLSSGSGAASGGSFASWGYGGSGGYSAYQTGSGTVSGSVSESGSETYTVGYGASGSVSGGQWVENSGASGDASASVNYGYSYSGGDSGGGGGGSTYDDPLNVTFTGAADTISLSGEGGTVTPGTTTTPPDTDWPYQVAIGNVVQTDSGMDLPGTNLGTDDGVIAPGILPSGVGPGVVASAMTGLVEGEATPAPGSAVSQTGTVYTLPWLCTSAYLIDQIGGMGNVAVAGYDGTAAPLGVNDILETLTAGGNSPGAGGFTSEEMVGGPFGRNSGMLVPGTWSWITLGSGFKGISAAPPAPGTDSLILPSTDSLTDVVEPVCFPAGIEIELPRGATKLVERIKEDDDVRAADQNDPEGPVSVGKVVKVYRHGPRKIIEVEVGGHPIRCTPKHPFYVRGRGFTAAENLNPGDQLRTSAGGWTAVGSVLDKGEVEPVYNFEVAGLHTYFVRNGNEVAVLVHNDSGGDPYPDGDNGETAGTDKTAEEQVKEISAKHELLELIAAKKFGGDETKAEAWLHAYLFELAFVIKNPTLGYNAGGDTYGESPRAYEFKDKIYKADIENALSVAIANLPGFLRGENQDEPLGSRLHGIFAQLNELNNVLAKQGTFFQRTDEATHEDLSKWAQGWIDAYNRATHRESAAYQTVRDLLMPGGGLDTFVMAFAPFAGVNPVSGEIAGSAKPRVMAMETPRGPREPPGPVEVKPKAVENEPPSERNAAERLTAKVENGRRGVPVRATVVKGANGRITSVSATIKPENLYGGTSTTPAARAMAAPDDAGHIIARLLGGRGGLNSDNVFAQLSAVNRGEFREFEKVIASDVRAGKNVNVDIQFIYPDATTDRPSGIRYSVTVDGTTTTRLFDN